MDNAVPRAVSGPGKHILAQVVQPMLREAIQYDRVSCYYSPRSLLRILNELAQVWSRGGKIRIIIGFHESAKVTPMVEGTGNAKGAIVSAVVSAMRGGAKILARILERDHQELVPVLRELIVRKALHVRLVTPRVNVAFFEDNRVWPNPEKGVFHSKFAIFHHKTSMESDPLQAAGGGRFRPADVRHAAGERFSAVSGSFNETERGYGENIEDAVVHRSWIDGEREIADYFLNRFESIWIDAADDVASMPFDDEFVEVVETITRVLKPKWFRWDQFVETLKLSPGYSALALPRVGLLPHQFRCYREALSRWPVRVLLADEVGLGKTVEAGSVINYLLRYGGVRRVVILTPASLRYQWQAEMRNLFNLDFWVYDPTTGHCELDDETIEVGSKPLSGPDKVIASWHWARLGATNDGCRFADAEMPDLLVVDEAHHARTHEEAGEAAPTQLYLLLKFMQKKIPHVLLLTATPFQTGQSDYYSLLDVLGVPDWFDAQSLDRFARWTRGDLVENFDLRVQQAKQAHFAMSTYRLRTSALPPELAAIPSPFAHPAYEDYVARRGPLSKEQVFSVHPTSLLTVRNTRSALKGQGYLFPEAHLGSADIRVSAEQALWFADLEDYIRNRLGTAELEENSGAAVARLRSLFRQRLVSSVSAARDSLSRRERLLGAFLETHDPSPLGETLDDEFSATSNDPEDAAPSLSVGPTPPDKVHAQIESAKNERYHIKRLLLRLEELFARGDVIVDPKMERLKQIVLEHLGDGRKVLIFSRFTSTTRAVIEQLKEIISTVGVGRFDGQGVGILTLAGTDIKVDSCARREIEGHLKSGRIRVLVGSDAASEGLNLHSASVAVNVDVPWNPSRVLQRFGRVDRLGQKASDVYLFNMYYPASIEARMYAVLEDRRVDFRAVLGEVPEVLSAQQRLMIESLSGSSTTVNLTVEQIDEARRNYHRNQFQHLAPGASQDVNEKTVPQFLILIVKEAAQHAGRQVKEIDETTLEIDGRRISINPLSDDFQSLVEDAWSAFQVSPHGSRKKMAIAPLMTDNGITLGLVLRSEEGIFPVTAECWRPLFRFLFMGEPIDLASLSKFSVGNTGEVLDYFRSREKWIWPDHEKMSCLSEVPAVKPSLGAIQIGDTLAYVTVAGLRVPQADDIKKVEKLPFLIAEGFDDRRKVADCFGFHPRQSDYYAEAAELLGLVLRYGGRYTLTEAGRAFVGLTAEERLPDLARRIQESPLIRLIINKLRLQAPNVMSDAEIVDIVSAYSQIGRTTSKRRSQTVLAWLRFLAETSGSLEINGRTVAIRPG